MKKSEFAMVILIAAGSAVIAYFVAHAIFSGGTANQTVEVPTIQSISSNFTQPDPAVFNSNAINPTVGVSLSESSSNGSGLSGQ